MADQKVDTDVNSFLYQDISKKFSNERLVLEFLPHDVINIQANFLEMNVMNQSVLIWDNTDPNKSYTIWRPEQYWFNTKGYFEVLHMTPEEIPEANSWDVCLHILS